MRAAARLLASVQRSSAQYLEPGAPTGITGLLTAASPRSTLLYHYNYTLEKLKLFPEHSVYRKSTEALTRQRMSVVEAVKPAGLAEWQARVEQVVLDDPVAYRKIKALDGSGFNIVFKEGAAEKSADQKSDEEFRKAPLKHAPKTEGERASQIRQLQRDDYGAQLNKVQIEAEPPLTAEQINEIETKIGAGLIEEVIQVAEGESQLVDVLLGSKV